MLEFKHIGHSNDQYKKKKKHADSFHLYINVDLTLVIMKYLYWPLGQQRDKKRKT
jgi:hypothetical protein